MPLLWIRVGTNLIYCLVRKELGETSGSDFETARARAKEDFGKNSSWLDENSGHTGSDSHYRCSDHMGFYKYPRGNGQFSGCNALCLFAWRIGCCCHHIHLQYWCQGATCNNHEIKNSNILGYCAHGSGNRNIGHYASHLAIQN